MFDILPRNPLIPDIILARSTPATVALQRETRTIPILFAGVAEPVASGLVARLDRPGGNVTGFAGWEPTLGLELLSEFAPGLKRAAFMFNPDTAPVSVYMPSLEMAARSLLVELIIAHIHSDAEIETAIIALGRERPRCRAAERSDEFAPSKANAHLPLLCLREKKLAQPKP